MSLCLICAALAGSQAAASTSAADNAGVIIVTGERIRRTVRDTASSVAVYTSEDIETAAGADRLDQLLEQTPNVTTGTNNLGPTIRGQNSTGVLQDLPAFLGGTRQRVTLQVDGRAVGFNEFMFGVAPLWDVEQVEIYRSPQTTTQGRNSIAGAIIVETNDPAYAPEVRARAVAGSRSMSQFSAMATGPLVDGQLAVRIAGDLRHGRPTSKIADNMAGADPNNDDYGLLRVKLLAEPQALPGSRVELTYAHSEAKAPQVEGVRAPFEERADPMAGYGIFATRVDSVTGRFAHQIDPDLQVTSTISFGDSMARRFAPEGLGEARNAIGDRSLETTVGWRPSERLNLIAGVHYLGTSLDQFIDLSDVIGIGDFRDRQNSIGLFIDAAVRPLSRMRLSAGLRFQRDSQARQGGIGNDLVDYPIDYDEDFQALLPKVSLAYDFTPSMTAGILIQKAYNPGGMTLNLDTAESETFGPEHAWSYELFARASIGSARFTANLFHTQFRNAQRAQSRAYSVPGGGTAFWAEIENVPRSRSTGAEIGIEWPVTDRFRVSGGVGLLRTRITRTTDPANPINGMEFQRSPNVTASAAFDWRPVSSVRLRADIRYHGDYFSTDTNSEALLIKANAIANGRAAWTTDRTTLFGYARNIFDTFYMTHLSSVTFGTAVAPRELGIGIETRF